MEVWVLLAILSYCRATTVSPPCARAPLHAQPADGSYRLHVHGDPDLFLPGELYTGEIVRGIKKAVTLQGVDSGQGPTPFVGFTIWTELEEGVESEVDVSVSPSPMNQSLGSFQAYDAQAKLRDVCQPAVDNATAHPKTEVQVMWSAPSSASACVRLCAQAGPANGAPVTLARKLCAAPAAPPSFLRPPQIVEPCCACDEAKYEVTFEGLWSRNLHPKDFPSDSARAHFGDMIGASHTARYRVWQEGRVASIGLRRLADDGATTALEKELKAESDHIRTIIKARGISWQQIASRTSTPSTFAVFRVDAKHHLVSLASKLAPSPDWFVGVSAYELCNANCTWSMSATLPLYPYDAGTDSGMGYTSGRQPSAPHGPVRALRPDWPRDPRSPFYNAAGEMRPFARLKFTRLRLYEKSCEATGADPPSHSPELSGGSCAVLPWGAWGPCSVSCGGGRAARQRQYAWPARAYADACRVPLTQYRRCKGPRMHCRAPTEYEPDPAESTGPCAVSQWSEWSPCEGCGVRARTRHYVAERAHKRCHVGLKASTVMSQAMPCEAGPCERPPGAANASNFDWFYVDNPRGECSVTSWGPWSPCSAGCGRGRRLRTRLYTAGGSLQPALAARLLRHWNQRFAQLQGSEQPPENVTSDDPGTETKVQEYLDRCQYTLTLQEALCDGEDTGCLNSSDAYETCKLPPSVGHCRSYEERWFHDATAGKCEPFGFTGCGGNANNFRTEEACRYVCRKINSTVIGTSTVSPTESSSKKSKSTLKPTQSSTDNEVLQNDAPAASTEGVDCEVGPWRGWGECSGDCSYAFKLNYRLVLRIRSGQGKPCAKLVKNRVCKPHYCRKHNVNTDHGHGTYDDISLT